ncbi:MAG: FtsW/RodA/SpoVE family cell cycle protein [Lachnospiraceae bacterium]|nr:FtsW/RodA/SpoVE family cell cycle protein [Lachnospiraceae bacterium]
MLRQYKLRDYRFSLILWVTALSVLGIMIIGSAQQSSQIRQIMGLGIGLVLMVVVSLMDFTWLMNFYWIAYIAGNALLLAVLLVGVKVNGATRWINLGIQFQPSDVMKIILILFFAKFFSKYEEKINTIRIILFSLVLLGIPLLLIYAEPDLSTTIVTALTFCAIIFIAGLSYKIIGGLLLVTVPAAVLFFSIILQPGQTLLKGYQLNRIMAWLKPSEYVAEAYQQTNSIIAIGSGQLYGKGLNNNMVSSVKNGNFIAEPQTDFIFAVAGEELGFLGCCLIVLLELLIALECIRIGRRAKDLAGTLFCCGMAALITFQSFLNICVATGLMPNTGVPLPFVSYGLTSLVSFCIGIGIVLNIGLQTRKY